ncbi:MAG: DUF6062 family protein [Anaerolineae bacterium]
MRDGQRISSSSPSVPYLGELLDALEARGCPICRLVAQSAERHLDAVLWEQVNDPALRSQLNEARGYCQQHAWLLVRPGAALGTAILARSVLHSLLEVLSSTPVERGSAPVWEGLRRTFDEKAASKGTAKLVEALGPQEPCPVCRHVDTMERHYITTMLAHLDGPQGLADAYRNSDGLCVAHLRKALARASRSQAEQLVAVQVILWGELLFELEEFVRKNDPRFRHEGMGEERDSWSRALALVSGPRPRASSERQGLTSSQ